jgi:hypothetical protein
MQAQVQWILELSHVIHTVVVPTLEEPRLCTLSLGGALFPLLGISTEALIRATGAWCSSTIMPFEREDCPVETDGWAHHLGLETIRRAHARVGCRFGFLATHALMSACGAGRLDVAEWLLEEYPGLSGDKGFGIAALRRACEHGHTPAAKVWFFELHRHSLTNAKWIAVKWKITKKNVGAHAEQLFIDICANGHDTTAAWFRDKFGRLEYDVRACEEACQHGHLRIVQWLLENRTHVLGERWDIQLLLALACISGHG